MPGKLNFKINRGETFHHSLKWKTENDEFVNLTGYRARMHIRKTIDSEEILLTLTTENNRIVLDVQGGFILHISADDTTAITWNDGVYDLEMFVEDGNGEIIVKRLIEGKITVTKEVTR